MPKVTFIRDGNNGGSTSEPVVVEIPAGTTLFDAGARAGVAIDTVCFGKGTCGRCRVRILAGGEHLSSYTLEERRHLGNVYHQTKVRLACRSRVGGDVTVQVIYRTYGGKKMSPSP